MELDKNFTAELYQAFDEKAMSISQEQIPALLSDYLNMQSLVGNLYSNFLNKGLLKEDPYKNDKKLTKITPIENTPFGESDNAKVLGVRLSDYVLMLDFICNYVNFSLENLGPERLKELMAFNASLAWDSISVTSKSANARALAEVMNPILQGSDALASNLTKTSLSSCKSTMERINNSLKSLVIFQREAYKIDVRRNILDSDEFLDSDCESKDKMDSKIRLLFKQVYTDKNKKPLYPELINEIIEETIGSNKEQLRQNLLAKLKIENKKKDVKKKPKINPHDILMDSVHSLASISAQIAQVVEKFNENSDVFLNSKMTGFQKFKKRLRRAMGLKDKPVSYKITITDATTNTKHHETVQFSEFIVSLEKKARNYAILSQLDSSGHKKFEAKNDTEILDFVIKQLCDWQKISQTISGLDDFFKTQTPNSEKAKIKGIKVEIMAIKNAIIKANQKKTDYISIIEEQQQMEKLGITDED